MTKRAVILAAGFTTLSLALAGCGVSVAAGGENAATHPASGIFESNTVGGGNMSGHPDPSVPISVPATTPSSLPSGLSATSSAVQAAVTGGCWEDSHEGSDYGAYDQIFWWQGQCGDTIGQMTIELYPSVAAATKELHHSTPSALLARYQDGAVIVDVYSNAPLSVLSQLGGVSGLTAVPGYGQ